MFDEELSIFHALLLCWYDKNKRDFPWRYTFDPYKVFVSEILLQQTNVEKIITPHYKIINKYRDINELANGDIEYIKGIFKEIGLFYRADRMTSISKNIIKYYGGNIPDNWDELIKIKGVGRYIAGTILCFGYNKPYAILDTNVIRIFERVLDISTQCSRPREDKKLWDFAQIILPKEHYVDYNYALLDFGAEVCSQSNPKCSKCIFNDRCFYT